MADLWEEGVQQIAPNFDGVDDEVQIPMTVEELLAAAALFPLHTGLGADNFAPRAILRLPRAAVQRLVDILMAAERIGSWSAAMPDVLIVLIPKADGGKRPIGLFPTVIRLWMRCAG